jgi:hypothetical protein
MGVPVVGALAVVVGVPTTGLTLGDPGVKLEVSVVGACSCGGSTGCGGDSLWVFLRWEHWQWWWGFQPQG